MIDWIRNHDDSWIFVGLYIGLAVVLSIWISLFWLVLMVALHYAFECVRQGMLRRGQPPFLYALWEVKLDIALVLMALALTLYMDLVLGLVGLQSAARASAVARGGIRAGARVAGWERAIRGFLLSADDVAQIARSVARARETRAVAGGAAAVAVAAQASGAAETTAVLAADTVGDEAELVVLRPLPPPSAWGRGDWFAVSLGAASLAAMAFAPYVTAHSFASAATLLTEQLRPLPSG